MLGTTEPFIARLQSIARRQSVARGNIIQRQFEPVRALSIVISGQADAYAVAENGRMFLVDDFKAHDIIGYELWLGMQEAQYDVSAQTDLVLLSFSKDTLKRAIDSDTDFLKFILSNLIAKFRHQTERLIDANTLSIQGRICAELKRHCKPIGKDPDTHIIRPKPIFKTFALRVGSTRESVSRTVSDLVAAGVVTRTTGALIIPDMALFESWIK